MIILAATLVALLVGTAYYAGTGFWKKPRLAIVTFVSLFAPAVFFLPFSGWEPPLIGWSSGWAYLVLVYLAVHLAGLLAWFWALVDERLARLFHKLKVGLIIFLGIGAVWLIFRTDGISAGGGEVLDIVIDLVLLAIVVFSGLWLFRILREKLASRKKEGKIARLKNLLKNMCARVRMKPRSSQDQSTEEGRTQASQQAQEDQPTEDQPAEDRPPEDQPTEDRPKSEPPESHPKDGKTAADHLKDLMKNVRVRPDLKVRFEDLRPRFSQGLKIENLRSRIPWSISVENIGAPVKKLFGRLRRTIRDRSGKPKKPPPPP